MVGGLLLDRGGPGALPWSALVLMPLVLAVVVAARGRAFPSGRADHQRDAEGGHRGGHQAVQHTP